MHTNELIVLENELLEIFQNIDVQFVWTQVGVLIGNLSITYNLREIIQQSHFLDLELQPSVGHPSFTHAMDGILLFI